MIGIISGSGFYDLEGTLDIIIKEERQIVTKYGSVNVVITQYNDVSLAFISRHNKGHTNLPNQINYKANLLALKEVGVKYIISTTVCGILRKDIPLATPIVFTDLFFPDNRLPSGQICSVYDTKGDKMNGHYIFETPFSKKLSLVCKDLFPHALFDLTYAHANGPRFNSKAEISYFATYAHAISQTAGPEIVLAGELEIPMLLLGFGVDYANGVSSTPTPINILNENLRKSKDVFIKMIKMIISNAKNIEFESFVYRFP